MANKNTVRVEKDARTAARPRDPRQQGPSDVSAQPQIEHPGKERGMNPKADHGEKSYRGYGRLKDRVALITGADSGIGRAVAIAFAREGADVVVSYLSEHEDAKETAKWVEQAGRKALTIAGDIQNEQHCLRLIEETYRQFGRLDTLVNNAAYQMEHEDIQEQTTEELERTFRTNVFAMHWLSLAAMKRMKPGSVILNTASIQAYDPNPGLLPYAATKAAIVNFTKALSKAAMEQGVRVNAIAPGPVWTPLIPSTLTEEHVHRFGKNTAFERPAQPAELAPIYAFLASDDARFVTGEVYGATGGNKPY
ncbi:MAG: SDR family oxidoreductase [Candidatus Korobacteraceae bacterium]